MGERWRLSPYQKSIWDLCRVYEGTAVGKNGGYFYTESMTEYKLWNQVQKDILKIYPILCLRADREGFLRLENLENYQLPREDLQELSLGEAQPVMENWMREWTFLEESPMFDWRFVQLKDGICMYGAFQHLVMDSLAISEMLKKQEQLYSLREKGESPEIYQERDFLEQLAERAWERKDWKRALGWYEKRWEMGNLPASFLHHRPDGRAQLIEKILPEKLVKLIQNRKEEWKCSAESFVYAGLFTLLAKLGGGPEIAVERVMGNRGYRQLHTLGLYANVQPIRQRIEPQITFRKLTESLSRDLMEQFRLADYPFEWWKERFATRGECFDCLVSYRNQKFLPQMQRAQVGEIFCGTLETPLRLIFDERADSMRTELQYAVKEWGQEEASSFLDWFQNVLEQGLKEPDIPLSTLEIWHKKRKDIYQGENRGKRKALAETCLENLQSRAKEIVLQQNGITLTGEQILQFCYVLSEKQKPGTGETLIGLDTERTVLLPAAILGALCLGYGFFILPQDDSLNRKMRLAGFCENVWNQDFLEACWQESCTQKPDRKAEETLRRLVSREKATDVAYAVSTSGTTGNPKVIRILRKSLATRLQWMQELLHSQDQENIFLQKTRLTFDVAVWELLLPFFGGGKLLLLDPGKEADFPEIACCIQKGQVSVVHFVPSALESFLNYAEKRRWSFPGLRHIISSGEVLPGNVMRRCLRVFPHTKLWNFYGPAECTIDVSFYNCKGQEKEVPIGQPVWGTRLMVMNLWGEELPDGIEGELVVAGELVGDGYLGENSDSAFTEISGQRCYRTGDRAVWKKDGNLYYRGRKDRQIKLRGMRLNIPDVENALEKIPQITGAAVRLEGKLLTAYYTGKKPLLREEICRFLSKDLPWHSMPDRFIYLESFPLGPNGKKDLSLIPEGKTEKVQGDNIIITRREREVAEILAPYLGGRLLNPAESFFEAGLTSIGAAQAVLDLEDRGYPCSYRDFYNYPTIRQFLQRKSTDRISFVRGMNCEKNSVNQEYLVCFPYAGGGDDCFLPLRKALKGKSIQVLTAVTGEYPELSPEKFAEKLLDTLPPGKIHAVGYCIGMAGALALVRAAQERGRRVESLWLLGALPRKAGKRGEIFWDHFSPETGVKLLNLLYGGKGGGKKKNPGREVLFSPQSYDEFCREVKKSLCYCRDVTDPVDIPAYLVFGGKDLFTVGSRLRCRAFEKLLPGLQRAWIFPGEGHNFVKRCGKQLARLIEEQRKEEG